jgi:hypothetical protein
MSRAEVIAVTGAILRLGLIRVSLRGRCWPEESAAGIPPWRDPWLIARANETEIRRKIK